MATDLMLLITENGAESYCDDCAYDVQDEIRAAYGLDVQAEVCQAWGEYDFPLHCTRCGVLLWHHLTQAGVDYVREQHAMDPSDITRAWVGQWGWEIEHW